jgi:HK97 family phage major capsid protein
MTVAAPEKPDQWEEYVHTLDTPEKAAQAFESGEWQAKLLDYGKSQHPDMVELRAQMAEQAQNAMVEMFERNGHETKNKLDLSAQARRGRDPLNYYVKDAPGARLDGKYSNVGEAFQTALWEAGVKPLASFKPPTSMLNYSTHDPASGGFLVPEEVRSDILTRSLEVSIVRGQAQVVPMPSGRLKWPVNDFTTEVGEVYGGIYATWVAEGEEIPATEGKFAMLSLDANKLAARAEVPNELLRSAPAFAAWLTRNMPNAVGHGGDLAYIKGDGVGKPLGGLHADNPALITVNKESGQPADTITWINILAMVSRMLPENLASAEWDVTLDALTELMTMALPVGTGGSAVFAVNAREGVPPSLFGRPIRWTRKTPGVLGDKGDISLVDWSTYVIGDTQSMALESSAHEQFSSDKTVFRAIERGDGQPGMLSALTPENGGPTLSAYVQLEARA